MAELNQKDQKPAEPEEIRALAADLDQFGEDFDTYEYRDTVEDKEENIRNAETMLLDGKTDGIRNYLLSFIDDDRDPEAVQAAKALLERMDMAAPSLPGTTLALKAAFDRDYSYIRVTNMEPDQVKGILEQMIATVPEDASLDVEEYIKHAGGQIEQIGGAFDDFSPNFPTMLEYNFDTNKVYDYRQEPDTFTIYQIKRGEEYHFHRFEPLEHLERFGLFVNFDNYEKIYSAPLPENGTTVQKLNQIYDKFNFDHPADFRGHSLSVSDIIVFHEAGKDTAHYVDSFGFKEVPAFFKQEPDKFRYYITQDALNIGTYPHMGSSDVNRLTIAPQKFEQGTVTAFGYLEYPKPLTPEQVQEYGLLPSANNPSHIETVEKTQEQNYNHIDGILNNLPDREQVGLSLDGGSRYMAIQTCDDGYDYTFYNAGFEELDGGQLDNPELSMAQAIYELLSDEGWQDAKLEALDYEFLMEKTDTAEKERLAALAALKAQEAPLLRVVPVGRFERYIEPSEITQDQYIVKGGILLSPCASNPDYYESSNRALDSRYIDPHIYEVAQRSKSGNPTAFRVVEDAPVENPFEPVGKEIGIAQAGQITCGLVFKHQMEGFKLTDQTVLLQKERDAHGNYYGGISLDGMMLKTPKMYAAVKDEHRQITAFRRMREKDFSKQQPKQEAQKSEKKPSIREQLAKKPEQPSSPKPPAKRKDLQR